MIVSDPVTGTRTESARYSGVGSIEQRGSIKPYEATRTGPDWLL